MKKYLPLFLFIFSCGDGELQIEAIDFDDGAVNFCPATDEIARTLFFKINDDEALILNLQSGLVQNQTPESDFSSTIGMQSMVTYRLFSETVSTNYFCSEIPPVSPVVLEEIIASGGMLTLKTRIDSVTAPSNTKRYRHSVNIPEITLVNEAGERISDESGIEFGDYTTSTQSSIAMNFANFNDIAVVECDIVDGMAFLYKIRDNDELITLNFPVSLLENAVTDMPRTASLGADATFRNTIYREFITANLICTSGLNADSISRDFTAVSGTLSVETVDAGPDANGATQFRHTLTLSNFQLSETEGNPEDPIESFVFGSIVTTAAVN